MIMSVSIENLRELQYFRGCSDSELEAIKDKFTEKIVAKGEIFLFEGDLSEYTFFVVTGVVKVFKTSPEGKEQILKIASAGDSLNDVSTFDPGPNTTNMLAMSPLVLYMIKKEDIEAICLSYPVIAVNALRALANRVRRDSSLVEDLSFVQVTGRLAKMLLRIHTIEQDLGLRLTQQDMAAMVGTTREVVNRSLRIMEEKKAIRLERQGITIIDRNALEDTIRDFS